MIPEWVDRYEYPFVVHTCDLTDGRLAYVDEGHGPVLLFVHGNPGWSFEYRHLIRKLSGNYRCIAVDHLGFGLSEKPAKADYSPQAQTRRLSEFIDRLELDQLTLVLHDFGGPIGLSWALDHPAQVQGLILFNTWMWSLRSNHEAMSLFRTFDSWSNRFYYTQLRASPKFFLPVLVPDVHELPKHITEQFLFPFLEHGSRNGPYMMARHLIRAGAWFDSLWEKRERIEQIPMLLIWGKRDRLSPEASMHLFADNFPLARAVLLEDAGNLAPQQSYRRSIVEIRGFLRSLGSPEDSPRLFD